MKYKETPLKDITAYISKGIVPKYASQNDTNIIRVLNQRCNRNNLISLSNSRFNNLDKRNVPNEKVLKENDVLINSTGVGTAGRVAQVNDLKEKMTVDGHMIIIRPTKTVNPVFYGYAVIANQYKIEQLAEGSTGQTEINRDRLLKDIYIKLPSLDIQNKIANNLRILDNKISLNNQINANLVELSNTIFKQILVSNDLHEFTINDIGTVAGGGTPSKKIISYWNGNIPWLSPKDLSNKPRIFTSSGENYITQQGLDNSSTKLLPRNTVLFSSRAPIGYLSIAKNRIATNQGFKSVIPNKQYPFWFIYELLKVETPRIINEANGSTFKEVSGSRLKQHIVYVPKSSDVLRYNSIFISLFQKMMQSESEIDTLNSLKRALLNKLF